MTRRSWSFDIALALAVGVLGQLEAWWGVGATHRQGPLWAQATLYAVTAALLVVRRVHPLGCLVAIVVVSAVEFAVFGSPEGTAVALSMLVAGYTVGRRLPARRAWAAPVLGVVFWAAWSVFDPVNDGAAAPERLGTMVWMSPFVIAWLVGVLLRLSATNAEQRRASRRQQEAQAVAEERNRIARELHDVLGHSVSVMTVQASAVRRRLTADQAVERQALETVEAVGRGALTEMRRMVSALRQADDSTLLAPAPGLDQVDGLAEQFRTAGLPVEVSVSGTPRALAPALDLTAYRIVQEGLTNALRHADRPNRAEVTLRYATDHIQVAVRDDGRGAAPAEQAPPGSGLLGMRERVAVFGGSLVARARPGGGFELVASLPLDPA
ncbi:MULTISPECIES: sensor histidine kinase [unclassified Actinotalea]|uniref:sensor histidine kinase n=1 Tax=unclassified Actinotalea TaxID=2638618 RepID=UPI0015F5A227|nr:MULTISPECIES: sensor histidine kinase [unclassified Actinotalea]